MRSVGWVLIATAAGRLLGFAALAALARLLAPADFGLLAFALVYITYVFGRSSLPKTRTSDGPPGMRKGVLAF